ncbi:hypothetical protein G6F64_011043 [Rhizopus arrhizus]|uniref:Btz domain-containing protein n=1 Tax=Rhizopus oryzae TaxID=64495 RepID=A0A9P7BM55_RHIOR|nr:hypothetical protein G6F64_011043 [Rhizopus arrhizus]
MVQFIKARRQHNLEYLGEDDSEASQIISMSDDDYTEPSDNDSYDSDCSDSHDSNCSDSGLQESDSDHNSILPKDRLSENDSQTVNTIQQKTSEPVFEIDYEDHDRYTELYNEWLAKNGSNSNLKKTVMESKERTAKNENIKNKVGSSMDQNTILSLKEKKEEQTNSSHSSSTTWNRSRAFSKQSSRTENVSFSSIKPFKEKSCSRNSNEESLSYENMKEPQKNIFDQYKHSTNVSQLLNKPYNSTWFRNKGYSGNKNQHDNRSSSLHYSNSKTAITHINTENAWSTVTPDKLWEHDKFTILTAVYPSTSEPSEKAILDSDDNIKNDCVIKGSNAAKEDKLRSKGSDMNNKTASDNIAMINLWDDKPIDVIPEQLTIDDTSFVTQRTSETKNTDKCSTLNLNSVMSVTNSLNSQDTHGSESINQKQNTELKNDACTSQQSTNNNKNANQLNYKTSLKPEPSSNAWNEFALKELLANNSLNRPSIITGDKRIPTKKDFNYTDHDKPSNESSKTATSLSQNANTTPRRRYIRQNQSPRPAWETVDDKKLKTSKEPQSNVNDWTAINRQNTSKAVNGSLKTSSAILWSNSNIQPETNSCKLNCYVSSHTHTRKSLKNSPSRTSVKASDINGDFNDHKNILSIGDCNINKEEYNMIVDNKANIEHTHRKQNVLEDRQKENIESDFTKHTAMNDQISSYKMTEANFLSHEYSSWPIIENRKNNSNLTTSIESEPTSSNYTSWTINKYDPNYSWTNAYENQSNGNTQSRSSVSPTASQRSDNDVEIYKTKSPIRNNGWSDKIATKHGNSVAIRISSCSSSIKHQSNKKISLLDAYDMNGMSYQENLTQQKSKSGCHRKSLPIKSYHYNSNDAHNYYTNKDANDSWDKPSLGKIIPHYEHINTYEFNSNHPNQLHAANSSTQFTESFKNNEHVDDTDGIYQDKKSKVNTAKEVMQAAEELPSDLTVTATHVHDDLDMRITLDDENDPNWLESQTVFGIPPPAKTYTTKINDKMIPNEQTCETEDSQRFVNSTDKNQSQNLYNQTQFAPILYTQAAQINNGNLNVAYVPIVSYSPNGTPVYTMTYPVYQAANSNITGSKGTNEADPNNSYYCHPVPVRYEANGMVYYGVNTPIYPPIYYSPELIGNCRDDQMHLREDGWGSKINE